jgi:hypothetical protein
MVAGGLRMNKEEVLSLIEKAILEDKSSILVETSFKEALENVYETETPHEPNRKYEFTGEIKEVEGRVLKRIRRLSDGLVGGWVERESNLSHRGSCFIYDEAMVFEGAKVFGDAMVLGSAMVGGAARVSGNACVFGNAEVFDFASVCGNAKVYAYSRVYAHALVCGNAAISGGARIYGTTIVSEDAAVGGDVCANGNASISGNALIYKGLISSGVYKGSRQ